MKIKHLSIINFRCHKQLIEIPFHDLTTFIGENDCGKTTIIDFLEIMFTDKKPQKNDFFSINTGELSETMREKRIIGEIIFELNDSEVEHFKQYSYKDKYFKLKRIFHIEGGEETYYYGRKFKNDKLYIYKNMKAPDLKDLLKELGLEDRSTQEQRKKAVEEYIEENKDNELIYELGWVEVKFNEIKNFLPKFIRYDIDDYRDPNSVILKTLQEVFGNQIYDYSETGKRVYKIKELEEIIDNISNNLVEASRKLINYVNEYNDNITDIIVEPEIDLSSSLKRTSIKVKDNFEIVQDLHDKGFGTKKRMFMALMEWTRDVTDTVDRNIIRCYDEPDNNLHIEAQRKLFKTIKSICEEGKTQVVICTHSLFMIDSSPTDYINYIKRNEDGTTSVEYIASDEDNEVRNFIHNMCREMGLSNSHIFFEKCFILVEGETEANFLPIAYKKLFNYSMAEDGITLINLGGNGAAINFLKLLVKNKKDLTIVFLDRDSEKFNKVNLMKKNNWIINASDEKEYEEFLDNFFRENVIFIGEKEFEDAFSSKYIAQTLNKHRPKADGQDWHETEIEEIKRNNEKFSDALLIEVSKLSREQLRKPELGILLAENLIKDEVPEEICLLFKRVKKIVEIE